MNTTCAFCGIISKQDRPDDVVYEDNVVMVMLSKDWEVKGHTLVIWKDHVINVSDLSDKEHTHFSMVYRKVEASLLKLLAKQRAMTTKTGFLVNHLHYHIYPLDMETTQQEALQIFSQKAKYEASNGEKIKLAQDLSKLLNR